MRRKPSLRHTGVVLVIPPAAIANPLLQHSLDACQALLAACRRWLDHRRRRRGRRWGRRRRRGRWIKWRGSHRWYERRRLVRHPPMPAHSLASAPRDSAAHHGSESWLSVTGCRRVCSVCVLASLTGCSVPYQVRYHGRLPFTAICHSYCRYHMYRLLPYVMYKTCWSSVHVYRY